MHPSGTAASAARRGVLLARPGPLRRATGASGAVRLQLGEARDAILYVPPSVPTGQARPLVVFFHGAGGNAEQARMLHPAADHSGAIVLAPESRATTWDVIHGALGPDIAFLDRALNWTFERFPVDPSKIAASGFSDGASYALSIGLANGELFQSVIAFSPGFVAAPDAQGKPRLFVSHGTRDAVLPIERCSRRIVRELRSDGYDLTYREFAGPHTVPPAVADEAFAWWLE